MQSPRVILKGSINCSIINEVYLINLKEYDSINKKKPNMFNEAIIVVDADIGFKDSENVVALVNNCKEFERYKDEYLFISNGNLKKEYHGLNVGHYSFEQLKFCSEKYIPHITCLLGSEIKIDKTIPNDVLEGCFKFDYRYSYTETSIQEMRTINYTSIPRVVFIYNNKESMERFGVFKSLICEMFESMD